MVEFHLPFIRDYVFMALKKCSLPVIETKEWYFSEIFITPSVLGLYEFVL